MSNNNQYTLENIQNFKGKYPKQLWYLFLVEMWERFTFYGMRALLGLYISHLILSANYHPASESEKLAAIQLYEKEHNEKVDENHPKYYIITSEQKYKDDAEAISNKRYGTIQAFIYAMAFIGGLFADKLFGFRRSIFWGGLLMAAGTFLMAIPGSFTFYLGVSVLILGNGFFKPNISTMVGALYKEGDPRRDAGFSLFYSGINLGAFLSGLTIAYVGTSYSWSLGFSMAGICMLLGLGLFIFTQKTLGPIGLPPQPENLNTKVLGISKGWLLQFATLFFVPVFFLLVYFPFDVDLSSILGTKSNGNPYIVEFTDIIFIIAAIVTFTYLIIEITKATKEEASKLIAAIILIFFSILFWSFFEQGGGSLNFYANSNVESHGLNMTQVNNTINAMWVILLAPLIGLLWLFLNKRKKEPNTVVKFGLGFLFLGIGFWTFYVSKFSANEFGKTPLLMFFLAYFVITIGELCLSPIGLSMVTKLSPKRLYGVMMGTWFLASAFGQYGAGIIGSYLAKSSNNEENLTNMQKLEQYASGYETIAYISITGGLVLIALSPVIRKLMKDVK